jgi:hypothetical protein
VIVRTCDEGSANDERISQAGEYVCRYYFGDKPSSISELQNHHLPHPSQVKRRRESAPENCDALDVEHNPSTGFGTKKMKKDCKRTSSNAHAQEQPG